MSSADLVVVAKPADPRARLGGAPLGWMRGGARPPDSAVTGRASTWGHLL